MASAPISPQAPQAGDGGGASGQSGQGMKLMAGITRIAQMIAQQYPATSQEMEEINRQVQQAMQKVMGAQQAGNSPAPPQ